ncbi:MAG: hypothetical protein AAGB22_10185, partial [Bacteroidota bacterium]
GNTQQLQEFDQVYIQLYNERSKLIAGDFQLERPNSYFLTYKKRAQGGLFATRFPVNRADTTKGRMNLQASGSVSRGKFARNIIQGIEANQGPYRLQGAEGEAFIVVLSGTERIYIDGKLLTRGQENDYTIDYNTAELTFTAKQLITKDKRIVAEFQYSDRNYTRSLVQFTDEFQSRRLRLRFNLYAEQDAKNQPVQQDLTDQQKEILRLVGDSLNRAIAPSFDSVGYEENVLLYALIDSVVVDTVLGDSTVYDSIFVFSTNPEVAHYRLTFSNVGQGNGNYVLEQSIANGRVFRWVAPVNGVQQGDFEPVVLLVTPKTRQMVTLGGDYRISQNTNSTFEVAVSNNDLNTFSSRDGGDNVGFAGRVAVENTRRLGNDWSKGWTLTSTGNFEHLGKNFREIERFRSVEFDRDWNIRDIPLEGDQNISGMNVRLTKAQALSVSYGLQSFNTTGDYNALKNNLLVGIKSAGFDITYNGSLVNSRGDVRNTDFLRHKTLAKKDLKYLVIGYRDDFENNRFRDGQGDTLLANSYRFWEWEVFVTNPDTATNKYLRS